MSLKTFLPSSTFPVFIVWFLSYSTTLFPTENAAYGQTIQKIFMNAQKIKDFLEQDDSDYSRWLINKPIHLEKVRKTTSGSPVNILTGIPPNTTPKHQSCITMLSYLNTDTVSGNAYTSFKPKLWNYSSLDTAVKLVNLFHVISVQAANSDPVTVDPD